MIPLVTLDLRGDTFTTQAEMTRLIRAKVAKCQRQFHTFEVTEIVITPHQHAMLKLELAETFQFRWKNLKDKYLDNIDGYPVTLAEDDELLQEPEESWYDER